MRQSISIGLFFARYASGGIVAYATPRLLVASGVPFDQWIVVMGGWISIHVDREVVMWSATLLVGVAIYGGSILLSEDHDWRPSIPPPIKRLLAMVEPSHVIILGLVIAAVGVVWQMRSEPNAPVTTSARGQPERITPKPNRKYGAADFQALTPILQKASNLIDIATPLSRDLTTFANELRASIQKDGIQSGITRIAQLRTRAISLATALDDLQSSSGLYSEEVNYLIDAAQGNQAGSVALVAGNLSRVLGGFTGPPNQATIEIIQNLEYPFDEKVKQFSDWTIKSRSRTQELFRALSSTG
jgi:hypothetical protein